MFRNLSSPTLQSQNLRRRHQTRQERGVEYGSRWARQCSDFDGFSGDLDLSIHHANHSCNNRYEGLAVPSAAHVHDRSHYVSTRRRPRNSRGSKEAKKRRDARRTTKKLAVQLLDEQLSREIDETLATFNLSRLAYHSDQLPSPVSCNTSLSQPRMGPSWFPSLPPTPPELPPLHFSPWDINDFPPLNWHDPSLPQSPVQPLSAVPDWCPYIPSLMTNGLWSGKVPNFTDLSRLSEPTTARSTAPELSRSPSRELAPWNEGLNLKGRRHSRFFPPKIPAPPAVKLPPTACTLHRSDNAGNHAADTTNDVNPAIEELPKKIAVSPNCPHTVEQSESDVGPPSAANLWRILISEKTESLHSGGNDSCWEDQYSEDGSVALPALINSGPSWPLEIDGIEIPYVHANTLTGHANEIASYHSERTGEEDLADSAIHLAETSLGDEEGKKYNYELAATCWPLTPCVPSPRIPCQNNDVAVPVHHIEDVQRDTDVNGLTGSTEHFASEQDLFEADMAFLENSEGSTCDLATFLAMGHVKNCWCRDCDDEPELVEEEPTTPLDEKEGWMQWMTDDDDDPVPPVGSNPSQVISQKVEEEQEVARHPCTRAPKWDDFFPCKPTRREEWKVEHKTGSDQEKSDDEFIGYYDDGLAFAKGSDFDWIWDFEA